MHQQAERFRAAAFDLDGTLIDTAPDLSVAVNAMLLGLNRRRLPEERIREHIGGGIERLVDRTLGESLGEAPDAAVRTTALAMFVRAYGEHLFQRSHLYPGVPETLHQFAGAGVAMCCVTNKQSRFALPLLEAAQLDSFFAFTLCADRTADRKPGPNMLLAACARLGVEPAELLYVGDSHADVVAARAAGCPVVAVDYGYGDKQSLTQAKPDGLVGDLRELLLFYMQPPERKRRPSNLVLLTEREHDA
jgi:phosphoglycolate phosphatase